MCGPSPAGRSSRVARVPRSRWEGRATGGLVPTLRWASGSRADLLERGGRRAVEQLRDRRGRRALLPQKLVRQSDGLAVADPLGDAAKLLVAGDLEVLEGEGEDGQLPGRLRLGREE